MIADSVLGFYRRNRDCVFRIEDLRRWVAKREPGTAPASPCRILRLLRRKKRLDYCVLSRADSLYLFDPPWRPGRPR